MRPNISLPVKWLITTAAGVLALLHLRFPNLRIDSVTFGLLVVGAIPWMFAYVESAKFPGVEIKFREIEQAGQRITSAAPTPLGTTSISQSATLPLTDRDPNLALVSLRIELEKRLVTIAEANHLAIRGGLTNLILELKRGEYLPKSICEGLQQLVKAGNRAAHGAIVEPAVADWALINGPQIIATLDNLQPVANSE